MNNRRLITWITFLAVFAMAARFSTDADTWWHLRAGEWILSHHSIPQVDLFSYTRLGVAWRYPGWLVEVPMALIYRAFGPGGLNLWTASMVTLAFAFVWRSLSGGEFLRAFVIVLAAAASGVYWAARPYLVTFLLAAIFLWILEDYRWKRSPSSERRLWWLPILMVIWANSHGGFAVGFLLWGVYLAGELVGWMAQKIDRRRQTAGGERQTIDGGRRSSLVDHPTVVAGQRSPVGLSSSAIRLLLTGALMLLAVCINPSGPAMLAYPFKTVNIGALQDYIQEWQSPDFHSLSVQPFIWLLLLTFGVVGASRRRLALTDFLLVAGFAYLGLMAGRNVALFALAAPPVLSRHAAPLLDSIGRKLGLHFLPAGPPSRRSALVNTLIVSLIALAVAAKVALVFPYSANAQSWEKTLPVKAVEAIQAHKPPGRIFNSYNWGGYLLWALPEYPVFVDGRTDLYDDEIIGKWLTIARAEPGWQQIVEQYNIHLVLIEMNTPLDRELARTTGWRKIYGDLLASVYEKSP